MIRMCLSLGPLAVSSNFPASTRSVPQVWAALFTDVPFRIALRFDPESERHFYRAVYPPAHEGQRAEKFKQEHWISIQIQNAILFKVH
jgi:hypothetical protein